MQDRSVAPVTGANKGIGLETVRRRRGAGHRVYLASRDVERGRAAAEAVGREEGHLDVLVNNACVTNPVRDVHEYDGDDAATATSWSDLLLCTPGEDLLVGVVLAKLPQGTN